MHETTRGFPAWGAEGLRKWFCSRRDRVVRHVIVRFMRTEYKAGEDNKGVHEEDPVECGRCDAVGDHVGEWHAVARVTCDGLEHARQAAAVEHAANEEAVEEGHVEETCADDESPQVETDVTKEDVPETEDHNGQVSG